MHPDVRRLSQLTAPWSQYNLILGILSWDEEVMMPPGGAAARAPLMGLLAEKHHESICNPEIGRLLEQLKTEKLTDLEQAVVRVASHTYYRTIRVPPALVRELAELSVQSTVVWREARSKSDFSLFAPYLEKIITLVRKQAHAIDPQRDAYDVLLAGYDEELSCAMLDKYFAQLRAELVPFTQQVLRAKQPTVAQLDVNVAQDVQHAFNTALAKRLGLDFNRARLDVSTHPMSFYLGDMRITTRYGPDVWGPLGSTVHETGHSLFEQGVDRTLPSPINETLSLIVHESQSRLFENHVLHSKEFIAALLPELNKAYGTRFELEPFYAAVNRVQQSFIRVEADELTYPLHVIVRYELEQQLIRGTLSVADLPRAWNAKMQELLGITPPNDAQGCLQDVHWSSGSFAYFPTYVLGSMLSAQLFAAASKAVPVQEELAAGKTDALLRWLTEHVHQHGTRYLTSELVQRATGKPLEATEYVRYLQNKYSTLYNVL